MAIYIKGMKMPTACENCLLSYWTGTRTWRCVPQDRKYSEHKGDNGSIRQEGCPLISEVSEPHGMSDLTREEAIQVLQTALTSPFIYGEYADAIDKAIEALKILDDDGIVNCCGCIHWKTDGGAMMMCELWDTPMGDFDYCSYGKRKGGDDE